MENFTGKVVDSKDTRFGDAPDDWDERRPDFEKTKQKEVLRCRVY